MLLLTTGLILIQGLDAAPADRQAALARALAQARPEILAEGFRFTEGPVWLPDRKILLWSDIPANRIYCWDGESVEVWREPSGESNGLLLDGQGRLLACEHGNRRVSRTQPDGGVIALAEHYQGKRLNSPNDLAVWRDGSIYFTDPPYGVQESQRELDFQGVFRIVEGATEPVLLLDDFDRPNGIVFSPDQRTLYVDDSARHHVRAFDVQDDGSLTNDRVFAEIDDLDKAVLDGMTVDQAGNLYVAGTAGVWVFDATGTRLGLVELPSFTSNCTFGGPDRRTLFITSSQSVYRLELPIPGVF